VLDYARRTSSEGPADCVRTTLPIVYWAGRGLTLIHACRVRDKGERESERERERDPATAILRFSGEAEPCHRRIPAMEFRATPIATHLRPPNVTGFFSVLASFQTSAASASGSEILLPRYAQIESPLGRRASRKRRARRDADVCDPRARRESGTSESRAVAPPFRCELAAVSQRFISHPRMTDRSIQPIVSERHLFQDSTNARRRHEGGKRR